MQQKNGDDMKTYYPNEDHKDNLKFNIYKSGVVADLTIHQWGARAKLNPEDLGMGSVPELIKLGHKDLMRKEHLERMTYILKKAERFLNSKSFVFPFGSARFIPSANIEEVTAFMMESDKEFKEALEEFLNDYDVKRVEMLEEYRIVFHDILRQGKEPIKTLEAKANMGKEINRLISRLESKYPSKEALREKFNNIDFTMFNISLPDFVETDGGEAIEKANLNMEYRKKASAKIDTFLESVIASLKEMVLDTTKHMKARLEAGNLNQHQIKHFVKFANEFKKQDFIGMDLDKVLESFKEKLSNAEKSDLTDAEFNAKLKEDLKGLEEQVINSDKSKILDRYLRRIEVASDEASG
jgi:Holliday junction resolvase